MHPLNLKYLINCTLNSFPKLQALYLFGSFANQTQTSESDIDLAILLPHEAAKQTGSLMLSPFHLTLEKQLQRKVDLINLRQVSTVLQHEVINKGMILLNLDENAVDEFEMLTLSFYQKLNEERKEILEQFYQTGSAYAV